MNIGLALPQYDYSVPGRSPLDYATILEHARHAEARGFDSLWLSDHLFLDLAKYGGPAEPSGTFEPLVTLAALAREVTRPRLGTLVLLEALRPATVLAKALATLDRLCEGRLDIGIGAGWYEPDYEAIGLAFPSPGERLARLGEAVDVLHGLLGGGPFTYDGAYQRARGAINRPPSVQEPHPPIIVGGKGDRLLQLVAERADGWNTCWVWTRDQYFERVQVLDKACDNAGRDPAAVTRSLGLYALAGDNETDLEARFRRMQALSPPGVLDGMTLDRWREGRLIGTPDQLREQVAGWEELGVETLILGPGAVPFQTVSLEDVALLADVLCTGGDG